MRLRLLTALAFLSSAIGLAAQEPAAPRLEKVTPRVSVILAGYNGIITVFASEKGPVVVDSADAASAPAVQALIRSIDPRPPAAFILTHYHDDHSAGLPTLAAGATLHLHKACQTSLEKKTPLSDKTKIASFTSGEVLHFGADTVRLIHPKPAHTGGDALVVFEQEKVIAAGDLSFNGLPPYIDVADGADTANWADTIEQVSKEYAGYKVIPGHGPLTDTTGWLELAKYLRALRQGVASALEAGQTREQAQVSVKLEEFTGIHDVADFLTKKANVGWVYDELSRKK
jgi:cyclase